MWLLAGHASKLDRPWKSIREDNRVKESTFEPFLAEYGDPRKPAAGREDLMRNSLSKFPAILKLCPELAELLRRLKATLHR
ncbi:MAG: hypothetical protein R2729_18555 [Bryobacteraceae bacterium]